MIDQGKTKLSRERIEKLTKSGLNEETVMSDILQQSPVLNPYSIYSTVMNPKKNYLKSAKYV